MRLQFATALLLGALFASSTCPAQSYRPPRLEDGRVDLQGAVVTERFTRTAADELTYEFAVTDPT